MGRGKGAEAIDAAAFLGGWSDNGRLDGTRGSLSLGCGSTQASVGDCSNKILGCCSLSPLPHRPLPAPPSSSSPAPSTTAVMASSTPTPASLAARPIFIQSGPIRVRTRFFSRFSPTPRSLYMRVHAHIASDALFMCFRSPWLVIAVDQCAYQALMITFYSPNHMDALAYVDLLFL